MAKISLNNDKSKFEVEFEEQINNELNIFTISSDGMNEYLEEWQVLHPELNDKLQEEILEYGIKISKQESSKNTL